MIASILILTFSAGLLVYWFRYSCVLLLRTAKARMDLARPADERYSIGFVLNQVSTATHLEPLENALSRDYQVLTYLIQNAADLEMASIENRLLILDYKMMHLWYRVTRTIAPAQSRKALAEMASVLGVVASQMDEGTQEA
jgi:hypothetical protein